jgi:hypothetical protein
MYFFLILMGFFHGFVIAPIILSMYNPKKRRESLDNKGLEPDSHYRLSEENLNKI